MSSRRRGSSRRHRRRDGRDAGRAGKNSGRLDRRVTRRSTPICSAASAGARSSRPVACLRARRQPRPCGPISHVIAKLGPAGAIGADARTDPATPLPAPCSVGKDGAAPARSSAMFPVPRRDHAVAWTEAARAGARRRFRRHGRALTDARRGEPSRRWRAGVEPAVRCGLAAHRPSADGVRSDYSGSAAAAGHGLGTGADGNP